jgi:hypothetical protein
MKLKAAVRRRDVDAKTEAVMVRREGEEMSWLRRLVRHV